ncbi:MAG TPA: glutathione S-transferase family protein [Rhizomicrobium sp.]|jgi:glutathione S-transferase|nr:glutathione S-transferase family protein [Rhizomicrobium sp.]
MAIIVYGSGISPFVRKVRLSLIEKGIDYKLDPVNPFAPPDGFLDISPLKRIPAFRDTDLPEPNTLSDSSVICDYIEHKFPAVALYPSDNYQRARALWFEEFADSVLATSVGGGLFFERIIKKFLGQKSDEDVCLVTLTEKLPPLFDYLEKQIGANDFLVENKFSIADISIATMLVNFDHAGETIDAARWPKLADYVKRIHDRPSFQAMLAEERPLIQSVRAA